MKKSLKERVYETLKIFKAQYPDLDICIVGSMPMYLQGIEHKYPHDIDIIILNNTLSEEEFKALSDKIYLMCWRITGLRIDLQYSNEKEDYNIIDLCGLSLKCNTPKRNKEHLEKFSIGRDRKYMDELRQLNDLLNGKETS